MKIILIEIKEDKIMKLRKAIVLSICGVMALSALAGCGKKDQGTPVEDIEVWDDGTDENTTEDSEGGIGNMGGWFVVDKYTQLVTDDDKALFDEAVGKKDSITYTPVAIISTQVVAGTNYAFLAYGDPNDESSASEWDIVVIYKDLKDNVSLTSIKPIDISDIATVNEAGNGDLTGAWEVAELSAAPKFEDDVQKAFDSATKGSDVKLSPIALLGGQVVSGMNYKFLCKGNDGEKDHLYVVQIYVNIKNEAELTSCDRFDIVAYMD